MTDNNQIIERLRREIERAEKNLEKLKESVSENDGAEAGDRIIDLEFMLQDAKLHWNTVADAVSDTAPGQLDQTQTKVSELTRAVRRSMEKQGVV